MLMSGLGALAAAIRVPQAHASVSNAPAAPPPGGASVNYVFQDDFNGPAGSAPDASKWLVAKARESMEDPTFWELPEHVGQYRDDRRNVYVDGKWDRVEHYHLECYDVSGKPYGDPAPNVPTRVSVTTAA